MDIDRMSDGTHTFQFLDPWSPALPEFNPDKKNDPLFSFLR